MNREEKEQYVIQLYKENRSTREIVGLVHMSFQDIGTILKKVGSRWRKTPTRMLITILNQNRKLLRLSNCFGNSNLL